MVTPRAGEAALDPDALGVYGRPLTRDPPAEGHRAVPADDLQDPGTLGDLAIGHADDPGTVAPPVAASAWANHAVAVLVPGVLAAWTLQEVGLDASPSNVVLHVEEGLPRRTRLRDPTPAADDRGRDAAVETLLGHHVAPLLAGLEDATGLAPRVGWGTVGTLVAWMYDRMEDHAPDEAPVASDRARLLEADEAAWGEAPNPLQDPVTRVPVDAPDLPDETMVRRTCCMKREIPAKAPCHTCPNVGDRRRQELLRDRDHG